MITKFRILFLIFILIFTLSFSVLAEDDVTLEASNYSTTGGPSFSGWNWLTDPSFQAYSKWYFNLPEPGKIYGSHIGLKLELLVTNTFDGGSGYSTTVKVTYFNPETGKKGEMSVELENPDAPPNPSPSQGKGYLTSAQISIPKEYVSSDGQFVIKVERLQYYPYHVATGEKAITVHYTPGEGYSADASDYELIWHLIVNKLIGDKMFYSPEQIREIKIESPWACAWVKYPEPPKATGNIAQFLLEKQKGQWVILGSATGWLKEDAAYYGVPGDVWDRISRYDASNPNEGPGVGIRTGDIPFDMEQLKAIQKSVDEGHQPWRLTPELVVSADGRDLGFNDNYTYKLISSGSGKALVEATYLGVTYRIDLIQPVKTGNGGIWTIVHVDFKF